MSNPADSMLDTGPSLRSILSTDPPAPAPIAPITTTTATHISTSPTTATTTTAAALEATGFFFRKVLVLTGHHDSESREDSPRPVGPVDRIISGHSKHSISGPRLPGGRLRDNSGNLYDGDLKGHERTRMFEGHFGKALGHGYESITRTRTRRPQPPPPPPSVHGEHIYEQQGVNLQSGVESAFDSPSDVTPGRALHRLAPKYDDFVSSLKILRIPHDAPTELVASVETVNTGYVLCNGTVTLNECADSSSLRGTPPLPSHDLLTKMAVGAILILVFVVSLTVNLVVLVMFLRRRVRLTVSSRFLLNLTVCNMLTAVFILPVAFTSLVVQDWVFGDVWCHVTGFILNLVIAASTLTLIVISLDRYHAIVTPLHYHMKMTRKRSIQLVMLVWVVALVCALPPIFGWNHMEFQPSKMICTVKWTSNAQFDSYYNTFIVLLCFILPLIALLWAYGVIFHAAKENSKRTYRRGSVHFSLTGQSAACSVLSNSTGAIGASLSVEASPALPSRRRSSSAPILGRRVSIQRLGNLLWYREERKTAVTCILIFMTFVACWSPYFIVILVETFSGDDFHLPGIVDTTSIVLAVTSCALDPLVYVLRNSQLRHEICVMLKGEKINNTQLV